MDHTIARYHLVASHLASLNSLSHNISPPGSINPILNSSILSEEYIGPYHSLITKMRKAISENPLFDHNSSMFLDKDTKYLKVFQQASSYYRQFPNSAERDWNEPSYKLNSFQTISEYGLAAGTRIGVHSGLYIDTLQNLGTKKHMEILNRAYSLKDYGCFALTELGHGSNVAGLETTATFDPLTREFILNSPTRTSAKWWIGALGKTANMAIIWAQLYVSKECHGVHAFVVEIRDRSTHLAKKGAIIGDCGKKIELDGIDNGFIIFHEFRTPYDSLLDFFSQINGEGKFKTVIKNKDKRLGLMLSGLMRGRMSATLSAEALMRNALTIAVRFALRRRQFGNADQPEACLLSYQLHQYRLMPLLARQFAIRAGVLLLHELYKIVHPLIKTNPESFEIADFHAILSVIKPLATEYSSEATQECRRACGGLGYSAYSGLGVLKNTIDVVTTWEGDNNVLKQQTAKFILKQLQKPLKGIKIESAYLKFLNQSNKEFVWPINSQEDISHSSLLSIHEQRIKILSEATMKKIQKNAEIYDNMLDIWNNSVAGYANPLASAFGEYIMLIELNKLVENISKRCSPTGKTIQKISMLYGIDCLERSQGVYIQLGCNAAQFQLMREAYIGLCTEVSKNSLEVVNALASPDNFLGSSIGSTDNNIYENLYNEVVKERDALNPPSWIKELHASRLVLP